MRRDIRGLATKYIDEVIKDQQQLGYKKVVSSATRGRAITHAETALRELEASSTNSRKVVAA